MRKFTAIFNIVIISLSVGRKNASPYRGFSESALAHAAGDNNPQSDSAEIRAFNAVRAPSS